MGALTPVLFPKKGISGSIIPKPIRSMRTTRNKINKEGFLEAVVLIMDFLLPFKSMLRNKLYSILLLSFILSLFTTEQAFGERIYGQTEPSPFKVGRLAVKYEMDRFQAKDNFFKGSGDLLGSFEAHNYYLGIESDLSLKWSFSLGFLFGLSKSSVEEETRINTNFKGFQFGTKRVLTIPGGLNIQDLRIVGDLKFFISFDENSYGSDEVSIGDGTDWLQAGVWAGVEDAFKDFYLWLYGGVNWPFREFSKNFIFIVQPEFKLGDKTWGVGLEGQIPIIKDKAKDNLTNRLRVIDEYNAGSFYYHSVNPQFIRANAWLRFKPVKGGEVKVGFSEALFGESAARGLRVFMNLKLLFSVIYSGHSFPYLKFNKGKSKDKNSHRRLKNYAKPVKR